MMKSEWLITFRSVTFAQRGERILRSNHIACRMQPCTEPIANVAVWRNNEMGFFCDSTIEELFGKANQQSADYIKVGLEYFNGVYTARDLLEDIGNKSYNTGITIDE